MKHITNLTFVRGIFVFFLSVFLYSSSMAAESGSANADIQGQLEALASNEMPNADSVRKVQEYLVTLGFDPGPIDGMLGAKTQSALKEWQTSTGAKISNAWLELRKRVVKRSGWICVSREKAKTHNGPTFCGRGGGGNSGAKIYARVGGVYKQIPANTGKCPECEIYVK